MSFASFIFLPFAAAFFSFWWLAKRNLATRFWFLLVFSMVFYGYARPIYVPLFLFNVSVSYVCARLIQAKPTRARVFLTLGILADLSVLIVFKYAAFMAENLNGLLQLLGREPTVPSIVLPLPIGISFYTFMSISFLVDVYLQRTKPARSWSHYAAYLSMFPHLVAGPIVRGQDLLPQLLSAGPRARIWDGLVLIVRGYFKKLVLADNLAPAVNQAFDADVLSHSAAFWWVAATMFGFQIYFDFSGYTDIARGLARWLGFEFPLNFDHPYSSTSFREFWQRWHISLSQWFRDYLYVPLGGNRGGPGMTLRNLWVTMLVSGLWHGANWTYVAWGGLHALYLTVERLTGWPERLGRSVAGKVACTAIVFALANLAWVYFRATTVGRANEIVAAMVNPLAVELGAVRNLGSEGVSFWLLAILVALNHRFCLIGRIVRRFPALSALEPVAYGALAALSIYWRGPGSAFIYFQF